MDKGQEIYKFSSSSLFLILSFSSLPVACSTVVAPKSAGLCTSDRLCASIREFGKDFLN